MFLLLSAVKHIGKLQSLSEFSKIRINRPYSFSVSKMHRINNFVTSILFQIDLVNFFFFGILIGEAIRLTMPPVFVTTFLFMTFLSLPRL